MAGQTRNFAFSRRDEVGNTVFYQARRDGMLPHNYESSCAPPPLWMRCDPMLIADLS
jgi:hypothetical protein